LECLHVSPCLPATSGRRSRFIADLDLDHFYLVDILHATLPEELLEDAPAAFTITGHIGVYNSLSLTRMLLIGRVRLWITAHLNLREEYLPYKYLIGQVVLDVRQYGKRVLLP
jgi:tRNA (guanine37-N1)-methyltransferase